MQPTSEHRVFVDANVLASPVPRTILYLSQPLSDFQLVFSPWVEREAERHQKAGHIPVSTLRQRFDWEFVPDADDFDGLVDTDPKDQPVLASAVEAKARYLVTANVRDFGEKDLAEHRMVAVHPGLFLAHHVSAQSYREVLEAVGEKRGREPRDPLSIHQQEISVHLPALFDAYRDLFGHATPDTSHGPPMLSFRGTRCVECYRVLREDLQRDPGLCQRCGADTARR
ncbi:PIN domain-containing protein [Promicromonospora sp. NPDC023805]|uniref:PIN domain-containing protein n=1 Tax=Promicromonospora sp. NPDC023805 TaxID=3154696 RepID=UPI00340D4E74